MRTVYRTMQWPLIIIMHWCILHFIPMATIYYWQDVVRYLKPLHYNIASQELHMPIFTYITIFCGHMTVFHSSMCIYLCHVNLALLVVIQLFRSVSSCPYRKNGYFVYSNSEGLWQHFLWVFRCFGPFQIFFFKTDTCQLVTFLIIWKTG